VAIYSLDYIITITAEIPLKIMQDHTYIIYCGNYSSTLCNHQHGWNHVEKPYKIIPILYTVAIYFLDNIITITVEIILKNDHRNV